MHADVALSFLKLGWESKRFASVLVTGWGKTEWLTSELLTGWDETEWFISELVTGCDEKLTFLGLSSTGKSVSSSDLFFMKDL